MAPIGGIMRINVPEEAQNAQNIDIFNHIIDGL